ncbi:energy transducer TonB [Dokdonia genika]|uniref:Energy transducer TonB n=1 Tax=Dokdonia genika TaxID=308113 RepID=A0ABV9L720_9FLAO
MKKLLFIIISILIFSCKTEKQKTELNNLSIENQTDVIIDPIEYPAKFKYGLDSIPKIIYSNMNLTDEKGTVWISIKIDSIGNLEKPKIMKSENEKLNSEALRLAELIPNEWSPAELGPERIKIASKYNFPIKFDEAVKILYSE